MFAWFNSELSAHPRAEPVTGTVSARMIFALRERLEEEGLGKSLQALNLDRAIVQNRDFVLQEMKPLFQHLDKNNIDRSIDHRFWWWRLDDEGVFSEACSRLIGS
jgi:hypothetical protein